MIARRLETALCADHEECLMQARTAVSWHFCPPSEAKSVVEEGHSLMKEQNLFLVSCKTPDFERILVHGEHFSLQLERIRVLRQRIPALAEAIFVSLLPKLLYRVDDRNA
jgi:hypothetical protein